MSHDKNLENLLLSELAEKVERYGYDKRAKGWSFYKKTSFGLHALSLAFIKHPDDLDVTLHVAVRFDHLEDLVNNHKTYLSRKEKKDTFSLGGEIGNISEGKQKRWRIADDKDIKRVASALMESFVSIGLPYLEKYSDLNAALQGLSGDDRAAWHVSPLDNERAMRAIGLAYLLDNREEFTRIATAKTQFLSMKTDPGLPVFLEFKADLQARFNEGFSRADSS
ncbi:MAG TPA: hypothetical protein VFC63_25200 [Blastocatellia bacterium]|nr:hypothetical protein [Blastocatellia bacterium]